MLHDTRASLLSDRPAGDEPASAAGPRPAAVLAGLIGSSRAIHGIRGAVQRLAPTAATVLLLGESGTGKERLARALHALSRRSARPLVAINCAAIPESLLESELFGHERGAFTGAVRQIRGRIETAHGGTLFLDEIGDMPLALQAKLLRFLQDRLIERVGGRTPIPVDVRILAATNRDLLAAVAQKTFRLDLFYRLSEVTLTLPPLRERESDAVLIASSLLRQASGGSSRSRFGPDAIAALESHTWPGNVRELENRVKRALILAEGPLIRAGDLGLAADKPDWAAAPTLRETRRRAESLAAQRALAMTAGNHSQAARLLKVSRQTLYNILTRVPDRRG